MPNARWVIDHFYVVMKANEAVNAVRHEIQTKLLRNSRVKTKKGLAYTLIDIGPVIPKINLYFILKVLKKTKKMILMMTMNHFQI